MTRVTGPASGLPRPYSRRPRAMERGGAPPKHRPSECAVLRAAQRFQSLNLIFLQLGQDVWRTSLIILYRRVIHHKRLKRHGILSSLAQRGTTIGPCRRSNADAARSGPTGPPRLARVGACRLPRASSILEGGGRRGLAAPSAPETSSSARARLLALYPAPHGRLFCSGRRDAKKAAAFDPEARFCQSAPGDEGALSASEPTPRRQKTPCCIGRIGFAHERVVA